MEMKILQNFKGMIGKTEFNREDIYRASCQFIYYGQINKVQKMVKNYLTNNENMI